MKKKWWLRIAATIVALCASLSATACFDLGGSTRCSECTDENADHYCDVCNYKISGCTDRDSDHLCDECGCTASDCVDADADHYCDVCETRNGNCTDSNGNHQCDTCLLEISYCLDADSNHNCDVCGARMGCVDTDSNGYCNGCSRSMSSVTYTVNYYDGTTLVATRTVTSGYRASNLSRSDKSGYTFVGWKTDSNATNLYDFTRPVQSNLTLFAHYEFDYASFTNEITRYYMDGIVSIHTQYREDGSLYASTGSGVIYKAAAGYYYVVTNNHVVYGYQQSLQTGGARNSVLTVRDCYETDYSAEVVCCDANYDLAVVRFEKEYGTDLHVFTFASADPTVGQEVACVGTPNGQKNAITYGSVTQYGNGNLGETDSHISFSCIYHSAWLEPGASGGLLMDLNYKIVGINYAIVNPGGNWSSSMSIPVTKVKEYLQQNNQW